jgi:hypothetical protein
VGEEAVVEEVHTDEVCEGRGTLAWTLRLAARERETDEHGEGDEEHAAPDESDSHVNLLSLV